MLTVISANFLTFCIEKLFRMSIKVVKAALPNYYRNKSVYVVSVQSPRNDFLQKLCIMSVS